MAEFLDLKRDAVGFSFSDFGVASLHEFEEKFFRLFLRFLVMNLSFFKYRSI